MALSKAAQAFLRETSLFVREKRAELKEREAVIGAAATTLLSAGQPVTAETLLSFLRDAIADLPPEDDASRVAREDAQQLLRKLAAPEDGQPNQGPA